MSDLDAELADLHDTLHSPPGFTPSALDLDHIMRSGTRRRRRIAAARGATVVAALAVFVGGMQTTGVLDRSDRGAPPAVNVTVAPQPPATFVETGLKAGADGDWVIKTVEVDVFESTKKTFGFSMNERATNGELIEDMVISEVEAGDEFKPGFHSVEHPYDYEGGVDQPAYGYFVGTPAKITATLDGRSVPARMTRMATTDGQPSVVVFWFDNTLVPGASRPTEVTAFDAAGKQLAQASIPYEMG